MPSMLYGVDADNNIYQMQLYSLRHDGIFATSHLYSSVPINRLYFSGFIPNVYFRCKILRLASAV
jgi:predicted GH43/DUF377 family glycosyl hydrolase